MKKGKVYLVGAGPGKPDLITVRGLNILKQADVVIYDYLADKNILKYTRNDAELISCAELGKTNHLDNPIKAQDTINVLMVKKSKEGKSIIRLKNGDPTVFSRISEELEALVKEGIEFEIVPGVSAANAASAFSGIALTDRKFASSCVFITGQKSAKNNETPSTLVFYMAVGALAKVVKRLIKLGRKKDTAIAIIKDITLPTQKVLTGKLVDIVDKAKKERLKPPAIVIVGKVATFEKRFNWFRKNKQILFTGLSDERFFIKGSYYHLPLIKIEPIDDYTEFDIHLKNIAVFDWIVFASRYGVEYFFKRFIALGYDSRLLNGIKIAAVGNSTKDRLLNFGIRADLVPKRESSEGLIETFRKEYILGKKIFLPRSDISEKGLRRGFERLGAEVVTSFAYRNVMPENLPGIDLNNFDEVIFTSPSTVRNFKKRYKKLPRHIKIKCIGNVTLKEAKRCKLSG